MKKRMLSLPLSAWFLLALCACGGGSAPTFDLHTETAYTHIDGLYVDTDYQDPEGQDRHMLYLFYTVYTPDQPLSVRSDATQLTVGEGETYSAEHYTGQCRLMPSYYYSSYLQDVSVGTPLAVVETFRIPAEVLHQRASHHLDQRTNPGDGPADPLHRRPGPLPGGGGSGPGGGPHRV